MIIQLTRQRSKWHFSALQVDKNGSIVKRKNNLSVQFPDHVLDACEAGSVWEVVGVPKVVIFESNGFTVTEEQIKAKNPKFIRPSGTLLVNWITNNIEGVGQVKAARLVRVFPDLDNRVRSGDLKSLMSVKGISEETAQTLIENWHSEEYYDVIEFLQRSKLNVGMADRLIRVYGKDALKIIKRDPFILCSLGVKFQTAISIAEALDIDISKQTKQTAIVDHVSSSFCLSSGSTYISEDELLNRSIKLCDELRVPISGLIESACLDGVVIPVSRDGYQPLGLAIQEATVARFIKDCSTRDNGARSLSSGWETCLTRQKVQAHLDTFESTLTFKLTDEQRNAVVEAVLNKVFVISGGAGTGKTTILLAILSVYEQVSKGLGLFQLALSGRAARRMQESTGREAMTIAKFIREYLDTDTGGASEKLPDHILLVIDEGSMVDLLSAYKLVGILPEATRILFVGDVAQLPPVGGGLVFHEVMNSAIPSVELTQVKRQGEDSGIHQIATAIRNQNFKHSLLNSPQGDVSYSSDDSYESILEAFKSGGSAKDCIVLTPTRKGPLGVDEVNKLIQSQFNHLNKPVVHYHDEVYGWIEWVTKSKSVLRLGDQVTVTKNDYDKGIRNGDIGEIVSVSPESNGDDFGTINIDGNLITINKDVLENIDLGYAITIHKSQGSQWVTCIQLLPDYADRMLDQTLLYTAVTRPSHKLIVLGDSSVIDKALRRGSSVNERCTNMAERLNITFP